jgi:hypothetical protein
LNTQWALRVAASEELQTAAGRDISAARGRSFQFRSPGEHSRWNDDADDVAIFNLSRFYSSQSLIDKDRQELVKTQHFG